MAQVIILAGPSPKKRVQLVQTVAGARPQIPRSSPNIRPSPDRNGRWDPVTPGFQIT